MAISAYVGVPGSGKTYEVVKSVIIPAYTSGRRIVTNIYGIQADKIRDYCINVKKVKPEGLGNIQLVSHEQIQDEHFFPHKNDSASSDKTSCCQPGNLVCLDEIWRIWPADNKIPLTHQAFIAEHRHFTDNASGVCCDLVIVNQEVASLPRFLKERIETTYRMQKLLALGLRSRYRVDVFSGARLYKRCRTMSYQCSYDRAVFSLYQSYFGLKGKEHRVDDRQSIFASRALWLVTSGLFILAVFSLTFLVRFFSAVTTEIPETASSPPSAAPLINEIISRDISSPVPPTAISPQWRIAGTLRQADRQVIILVSQQGKLRVEPGARFTVDAYGITGEIDGERVTAWSGGSR